MRLKKGDIVGRISYGKDIAFVINNIIEYGNEEIAILKGLVIRIEADSPIKDLELMDEVTVLKSLNKLNKEIECKPKTIEINKKNKVAERNFENYGLILHLDGDKKYSEKSQRFYKNLGLNVVVKNIAESKQPRIVCSLLSKYNPDVLVITRT